MPTLPDAIRSFRQPNYRRYFFGQAISMCGTFMQVGAIPWVVWELTHSARWLGAAHFLNQVPFLAIGLLGGAIADRFSRRWLIVATQALALLQASALAFFALRGDLTLPPLVLLIFVGGLINALDFPARQTFTMDLVGPADLSNAIALNATLVHTMRVVGPVLAGLILLHHGAGICFAVNAVTYVASLVALARIERHRLFPQPANTQELSTALREGFQIVRQTPDLRRPLLFVAITALSGAHYLAFLPYYADRVFARGPDLLGYLLGCSAAGALAGAVVLARARNPRLERWLVGAGVGLSVGLIVFALTPSLPLAMMGLFGIGMGFVLLVAGTNTLVQLRAPAAARGRIVSYLTTAFFGLAPVGSLVAGIVATAIGVPATLAAGGGCCLLTALWFAGTIRHSGDLSAPSMAP